MLPYMRFHSIKVKNIRRETADAVAVSFDIPQELEKEFQFYAGQYLNIRIKVADQLHIRSYSICSSPQDAEYSIAVKRLPNGVCSNYINDTLQVGDLVELAPPMGKFQLIPNKLVSKNYLAIAAGSGITPILSMIKTVLLQEPNSTFTLIYGNRNRKSIIFKETIEALKDKYLDRFSVIHILSREKTDTDLNFGRIDATKMEHIFSAVLKIHQIDAFFLCGPEAMVASIRQSLEHLKIAAEKIHFELFTTAQKSSSKQTNNQQTVSDGPTSEVQVILDGIAFDFPLAANGPSILEAAMSQGADLPFSCKSGVCCTCKARLIEGEVEMDLVYGLEPDEIDRGFILTCQSHPRSSKLVVDFDSK
jgi:ring-1,2-phenylacetyl-CoA epoxidase subunit PaaE